MTIPPWDGAWLIQSGMYGYMGIPEPTRMTVFSTMAERGPLASFLGFSVVPMVVAKRWRPLPGVLGWAAVILVFSVILLSMSRAGVIIAVVGCVSYVLINRGKGFGQLAIAVVVLALAGAFLVKRMPNTERVTKRFESLQNMEEDGSLQGRIMIMSYGPERLLAEPQGTGLGGSGQATRINTGTLATEATVVDAGWFNVFLVFGLPGSLLIIAAMVLLWKSLAERFRMPQTLDEHVYLARAFFITVIIASLAGSVLMNFSIIWLAFGCGLGIARDFRVNARQGYRPGPMLPGPAPLRTNPGHRPAG